MKINPIAYENYATYSALYLGDAAKKRRDDIACVVQHVGNELGN